MEGSKAVAEAKKQAVVVGVTIIAYLVLVAGVVLMCVSFTKERYDYFFPIGLGMLMSSTILFVMKWVAIAALTYIYKNE